MFHSDPRMRSMPNYYCVIIYQQPRSVYDALSPSSLHPHHTTNPFPPCFPSPAVPLSSLRHRAFSGPDPCVSPVVDAPSACSRPESLVHVLVRCPSLPASTPRPPTTSRPCEHPLTSPPALNIIVPVTVHSSGIRLHVSHSPAGPLNLRFK